MSCTNHCEIKQCGVLNPSQCPINKLWARAELLKGYVQFMNELALDKMWFDTDEAKDELVREAEALVKK